MAAAGPAVEGGGARGFELPERWLHCPRYGKRIAVGDAGEPLANAGFVPFKTLLDERYDELIPNAKRWNVPMLLGRWPNIGLIIDLTKSSRYYDNAKLPDHVRVQKLECAGHGSAPTVDQVQTFVNLCDMFWQKPENAAKLIGVHCTHGFNRTGAMITAFLVEKLNMSVEKALIDFSEMRWPGIYKPEYVTEWCERYDGLPDGLAPSTRPSWCLSDDEFREALGTLYEALPMIDQPIAPETAANLRDLVLDIVRQVNNRTLEQALVDQGWSPDEMTFMAGGLSQPARLRGVIEELLAERDVVMDSVQMEENAYDDANESERARTKGKFDQKAVEADRRCAAIVPAEPPHLGPLRRVCRKMISETGRPGFSGAQPVSLARENIQAVADEDYLMSWKADGTRYLLMINKGRVYLIGRDNAVFKVPTWKGPKTSGMWFPLPTWSPEHPHRVHQTLLLDGELTVDIERRKRERDGDTAVIKRVRYYAYDMIVCGDKQYHRYSYQRRQAGLYEQIERPRRKLAESGKAPGNLNEPFGFRYKEFWPVTMKAFSEFERRMAAGEVLHGTDGYIFAHNDESYTPGTCHTLLKWKPPDENTFDFKARVRLEPGKVVAYLMVTAEEGEVPFAMTGVSTITATDPKTKAELQKLDGKVLECRWQAREAKIRRTGRWQITRVRHDKTHPNHMNTCAKVWQSVIDGIDKAQIKTMILNKDHKKEIAKIAAGQQPTRRA